MQACSAQFVDIITNSFTPLLQVPYSIRLAALSSSFLSFLFLHQISSFPSHISLDRCYVLYLWLSCVCALLSQYIACLEEVCLGGYARCSRCCICQKQCIQLTRTRPSPGPFSPPEIPGPCHSPRGISPGWLQVSHSHGLPCVCGPAKDCSDHPRTVWDTRKRCWQYHEWCWWQCSRGPWQGGRSGKWGGKECCIKLVRKEWSWTCSAAHQMATGQAKEDCVVPSIMHGAVLIVELHGAPPGSGNIGPKSLSCACKAQCHGVTWNELHVSNCGVTLCALCWIPPRCEIVCTLTEIPIGSHAYMCGSLQSSVSPMHTWGLAAHMVRWLSAGILYCTWTISFTSMTCTWHDFACGVLTAVYTSCPMCGCYSIW